MKVYILAAINNFSFAEKLLGNIKNTKIISRPTIDKIELDINESIKKKIESADVILVIIDNEFSENMYLNLELQLAQIAVLENKNKILIPVVLGSADIPASIERTVCIVCDPNSEQDLCKTQFKIEKILAHKQYITGKRKLKENNSRTSSMIILTLAIEMLAVLFVVLFIRHPFSEFGYFDTENILSLAMVLITVTMSVVTLITSYLSIMKRRWQEDEKEEIASYSIRLKQAIIPEEIKERELKQSEDEDKKNEIDALGRMLINLEDIKEFYTWSQKQAKASFVLAVSMCISGFVLMIVAVVLPIAFRLSFQMSIIPAVGGIITELIAGTALVVYRNSLSQLNHYHKALHEDERFLSSVNLLGKFSTEEAQDDMLREIIRSEIQMNLAGLNVSNNMDKACEEKNSSK